MATKQIPRGRMLCVLGPGGDFCSEVRDAGCALLAVESAPLTGAQLRGLRTHLAEQLGLHEAPTTVQIAGVRDARAWAAADDPLPPVVFGSLSAYLAEEYDAAQTEETTADPYPETVARPHVHSGLQQRARVRAHHAGAGGRVRRQQGNRLRTHRRASEEGLSQAYPAQGTLFAT